MVVTLQHQLSCCEPSNTYSHWIKWKQFFGVNFQSIFGRISKTMCKQTSFHHLTTPCIPPEHMRKYKEDTIAWISSILANRPHQFSLFSYLQPSLLILLHMFPECHQIISIQVKQPVWSLKYMKINPFYCLPDFSTTMEDTSTLILRPKLTDLWVWHSPTIHAIYEVALITFLRLGRESRSRVAMGKLRTWCNKWKISLKRRCPPRFANILHL